MSASSTIGLGLVAALALGAWLGSPDATASQNQSEFLHSPVTGDFGHTASAQAAADSKVPGRQTRPGFGWPATGRVVMGFCEYPDLMHIVVSSGGAVRATEAGTDAYAGNALKGFRNLILVRHHDGWVSAYENADVIVVKRGDIVRRGQVIARIGASGPSQLHFELRHRNVSVDPRPYLEGADMDLAQATKRESCG